MIPGWDPSLLAERPLPEQTTLALVPSIDPTEQVSDHESDAAGWSSADNALASERVTTTLNAPGTPFEGAWCLETSFSLHEPVGGARAEAGVARRVSPPLDAGATPRLQLALNGYSGCPGATRYLATVYLRSGRSVLEGTVEVTPNRWNLLELDLGAWTGRTAIDRIRITFHTDSRAGWDARFQIDQVGFAR